MNTRDPGDDIAESSRFVGRRSREAKREYAGCGKGTLIAIAMLASFWWRVGLANVNSQPRKDCLWPMTMRDSGMVGLYVSCHSLLCLPWPAVPECPC